MAALYFSIAIAFVWYTFNGFIPSNITFDLVSTFIYSFYKLFFSSEAIVVFYAVVNALMFVLSRQAYHLDVKPMPYVFEKIYQPLQATSQSIVQDPVIDDFAEEKTPIFNDLIGKVRQLFKKKEKIEEKKQPTYAALEVTEEVVSFLTEASSHH